MVIVSKHMKLLTLSLILRTMPQDQKALLISYFPPDVQQRLQQMELEASGDIAQMDWTPIYQSWPELKHILDDCREEIRIQRLIEFADKQRPTIKQYILMKLGRLKKVAPIFISEDIKIIIDKYIAGYQ